MTPSASSATTEDVRTTAYPYDPSAAAEPSVVLSVQQTTADVGGISVKMSVMGFIPVGDLMRELVLALGAAMVIGSAAVVVRERRRQPDDVGPKPSMKVVTLNIAVGLILTVWGIGSIIAAR